MLRKNLCFLILLFIADFTYAQNYIWTQKASFPGVARYEAASFAIGTKGYICSGANFGLNTVYNDLWLYNQATNVWTQKANIPGSARYGASGFTIGQKGYVAAGWTLGGLQLKDVWQYNPTGNSWTQKTNFGGLARYDAFAAGVGTNAFMGLGYSPLQNDWWKYNSSTNAWTQKASFPGTARQSAAGFVISSKIYVGTGYDGAYKTDFWEYNPSTNAWTPKAAYTGSARYGAIGFAFGGKGYLGSGGNATTSFNTFKKYDPASDTWSNIPNMPGALRYAGEGFALGLKGYAGLGRTNSNAYLDDFWEYGPEPVNVVISKVNVSCYGGSNGSATATASAGVAPYSYLWNTGKTTASLPNRQAGTYTITVTDAVGTTGTASVTITQPTALTVLPPQATTVCKGSTVNLVASASGGTPPYQYSWNNGSFIGPVYSVSPTTSTTYTLKVTDANGCQSSNFQVAVTVINLPSASVLSPNGTFACYPDSVKLTTVKTPGYSYRWKYNGTLISGAIDTFLFADKTGAYKVVVTNTQGCSKTSSDKNITIQNIGPSITPSGTVSMCQGASMLLKAIPNTGYDYLWKKNNVNIPGATAFSYTATTAGSYKVKVTDTVTGCTAVSSPTTIVINCKTAANEQRTRIFPNPARDHFNFDFNMLPDGPVNVTLSDLSGRIIYEKTVETKGELWVSGQTLLPGIYIARIVQNGHEEVFRLLKTE